MAGKIVERELVGALRTRKAAAMLVVTASVCSLLVLLRWPTEGQADFAGAQARQVFRLFGYGLLAALVLLVPSFPATSLVGERIRGTLALLLQTPLRPWSIYLGKLAGVVGIAYLLLVVSLPAAAACCLMGGVSVGDELLPLYGTLALVALQYAALGLFVSSRAGSIDSALRTTYGLVLVLAVLTLGPYQVLQGQPWEGAVALATWLRAVSPLPAVMEILGDGDTAGQGLVAAGGYTLRYTVTALLSTALLMAATAARLKPTLFDRPRPPGPITDERGRRVRWLRRLLFVVDPRRRSRLIGRFINPVLVKEFRSGRFGRLHWQLRLVSACAVGTLGLTYLWSIAALDWGTGTVAALMILLQGALLVLLTPSLAAGLISAEVESGGWALLRATPLSAGQILRGKLLSVAATLALILLATLPGYGVLIFARPALGRQILDVFWCLLLTGLFAVALSAAVGSLYRRSAPATVSSYALLLAVCGGPFLFWLGRDTTFGHHVVERALTASPLAAALAIMEAPGFEPYRLVPACWWLSGTATLACLLVLRVRVWQLTRPQ
jgi:ABC-type transport system involved in multi-copper enzyme maturation permease subunit